MPIRNADFWAKTNGLCIFMKSAKTLGFWDFKKNKTKTKGFG